MTFNKRIFKAEIKRRRHALIIGALTGAAASYYALSQGADLSTIAKGYGVDEVVALLESQGHSNYLVEIGGEMRVAGTKGNGVPWRIAVEKPVTQERAVQSILSIGNNAIATSGDYRNYYEQDGKRISHTIDARTGMPITHTLASISVLHPSAMMADGWATALNVLGPKEAMERARKHNLNIMLITRTPDGEHEIEYSNQFEEYRIINIKNKE